VDSCTVATFTSRKLGSGVGKDVSRG